MDALRRPEGYSAARHSNSGCYMDQMSRNRPFSCPVCGEQVQAGAQACPHCGSDERTGWSERAYLEGLGIYSEEEYCETIEEEFGAGQGKATSKSAAIWIAALFMAALFLWVFVLRW